MELTITLSEPMTEQLQRRAEKEHDVIEQIATNLLQDALDCEDPPTVEEVVAKIKTLPPSPVSSPKTHGTLAEALRNSPHDPDFNLAVWEQQWASFEEELKSITIANDITERRR